MTVVFLKTVSDAKNKRESHEQSRMVKIWPDYDEIKSPASSIVEAGVMVIQIHIRGKLYQNSQNLSHCLIKFPADPAAEHRNAQAKFAENANVFADGVATA